MFEDIHIDEEIVLLRGILSEGPEMNERENEKECDDGGSPLVGATAQADGNGQEKIGKLLGLLDRRPEADDREGADEAQGERQRRLHDRDDEHRRRRDEHEVAAELLSVRERLAEVGVDPAQDPGEERRQRDVQREGGQVDLHALVRQEVLERELAVHGVVLEVAPALGRGWVQSVQPAILPGRAGAVVGNRVP